MGDEKKVDTKTQLAYKRTELAQDRTRWAADRTFWAGDRTVIAWIRTSLALIAFGFGVGRALEYLEKLGRYADPFYTAQIFGGGFILIGIVMLSAAVVQSVKIERRLEKRGYPRSEPWPLGLLSAIMLLLIGIYGFVVILLNP
ncbi:MAG TPA: YidH family protein [Desulfobacterales bacterium]